MADEHAELNQWVAVNVAGWRKRGDAWLRPGQEIIDPFASWTLELPDLLDDERGQALGWRMLVEMAAQMGGDLCPGLTQREDMKWELDAIDGEEVADSPIVAVAKAYRAWKEGE